MNSLAIQQFTAVHKSDKDCSYSLLSLYFFGTCFWDELEKVSVTAPLLLLIF